MDEEGIFKDPIAEKDPTPTNKTQRQSKKPHYSGYVHAVIMLFCFGILLGTTYTEQQPYVYSGSHQALMIAVKESQALDVKSVHDIWKWIQDVVSGIGGKGIESINANCQYDAFHSQEVKIDGVTYSLGDPSYDASSCDPEQISFVTGSMNEVYLTGNHQLLSFGIFSMRSVPQYPVENSVKNARQSLLKVRSSKIQPLHPLSDDKIVEVCDVNWGKCLHRDGFSGQAGSTFGWIGREIDDYYTFQEGSEAFMIFPPMVEQPMPVEPCFTYHEVGPTSTPTQMPPTDEGPPNGTPVNRHLAISTSESQRFVAQPGNPDWPYDISNVTLSNCVYKWVSSGYDVRLTCLNLHKTKPTPLLSYLARRQGEDEVTPLLTSYFGCDSLLSVDSNDMQTLYVASDKCLESNILGKLAYGVFFSTANQDLWIRQSVEGLLQLQAHNYIDDNTRIVRVYFITRSLGHEQLFYTIITVEFRLNVDGSIKSRVQATYVPMIMFHYGYNGYDWRSKDVYFFEIILLIIFVLFTFREIYQLLTKRRVWLLPQSLRKKFIKERTPTPDSADVNEIQKKPTPLVTAGNRAGAEIVPINFPTHDDADHGYQKPREDLENQASTCDPVVSKKSKKSKPSVLGSLSSRMHVNQLKKDVNEVVDGVGDTIEEMIDDYTPDSDEVHDMLDWATIVVITLAIIYRVRYVKYTAALHTFLVDLEEDRTYDEHVEQIVAKFANVESQNQTIHLIAIAVVAVGILQFFRYLSFNKRFGIVTTTIAASTSDLIPVLVIFVTIVIAYAVLASEIYGIQLEEYSTVQTSLAALFIVLLGNFDYYSMEAVSPVETAIFFWSFVVVILFILLNMVLAVIFTVYEEKNQEIRQREKNTKLE